MKTTRGIYYDLNESEYKYSVYNLTFKFSSKVYLDKFLTLYPDYIKNETLKLNSKFKCNINAKNLLLISLYKKIEKRGFNIIYNGVKLDVTPNYLIDIEV